MESRKNYRDSRLEFERDLNLLAELVNNGKMRISSHLKNSTHGIDKVRYSPNKRMNLNTVNEMVRNMAMMAGQQPHMEEEND